MLNKCNQKINNLQIFSECQCLPGYVGNPKDRNGCRLEPRKQCLSHDECAENEECRRIGNGLSECRPACEGVVCAPQAVCVATNNHFGECKWPSGKYDSDSYDLTFGCGSALCVYNEDCPSTHLCDRLKYFSNKLS